ncbi:MAG: hypothetical protein J6W04_04480 [Bacteroidales bacterium]|nr:hypothetical protein [Bacteroidales bacterium]
MLNNILTNGMPTAISVNGIPFDIYTDFRTWIQAGYLIQKIAIAKNQMEIFEELCDLVVKEYPKNYLYADDFLSALIQFYSGFPKEENDSARKKKEKSKENPKPPSYDFVYDAHFIYCSFASFYNIRLQEVEYMHWWEFLVLFEGLMMSENTSVNFVVGTRQTKIKNSMPKEEKQRIQKLQKEFALPDTEVNKTVKNNLTNKLASMGKPKDSKLHAQEAPQD